MKFGIRTLFGVIGITALGLALSITARQKVDFNRRWRNTVSRVDPDRGFGQMVMHDAVSRSKQSDFNIPTLIAASYCPTEEFVYFSWCGSEPFVDAIELYLESGDTTTIPIAAVDLNRILSHSETHMIYESSIDLSELEPNVSSLSSVQGMRLRDRSSEVKTKWCQVSLCPRKHGEDGGRFYCRERFPGSQTLKPETPARAGALQQ